MNAINGATAASAAAAAAAAAATAAADKNKVKAANQGAVPILKPGPPLPPRTHARHVSADARPIGARRSSGATAPPAAVSSPSPALSSSSSAADTSASTASAALEQESSSAIAPVHEGTTEEELIPLNLHAHLLMSTYMLLYMALHLFLPAFLALPAPILAYMILARIIPVFRRRFGRATPPPPTPTSNSSVAPKQSNIPTIDPPRAQAAGAPVKAATGAATPRKK
jgi:hypothetical protein